MEELCCLFASGELSQQEMVEFSEHLENCSECRAQTKEFEKLIVFELSPAAALRMEDSVPEAVDFASEQELMARIRNRATTVLVRRESPAQRYAETWVHLCAAPLWKRAVGQSRRILPWVGWVAAAVSAYGAHDEERGAKARSGHYCRGSPRPCCFIGSR